MPPKLTELALLKQRLPKLVDDLSVELNKVMQIVTTNADLDVNLEKECSFCRTCIVIVSVL